MKKHKDIFSSKSIQKSLEIAKDLYPGLAIGVVNHGQESFHFVGVENDTTQQPINENTPFEIGSITKTFTAVLLAKFANEGLLELDGPAQSALPKHVSLPKTRGVEISFRQLSNHRSGLPRLPKNLNLFKVDPANPYVDYSVEDLYDCLNAIKSNPGLGAKEKYSNFGVGLLGHLLGRLDKSNFESAVKNHLLHPLGMHHTAVKLSAELENHFAQPHNGKKACCPWEFQDSTVAAGGLRSTIVDMTKFLQANLDPKSSAVGEAIKLTHQPSEVTPSTPPATWPQFFVPIILALISMLVIWFFKVRPGNFVFFATIFTGPILCALFMRWWSALLCLCSLAAFASWQFGAGFDWVTTLIYGGLIIAWAQLAKRKQFDQKNGRLAWQAKRLAGQEVLWHNGMVGGSASYMGFVPSRNQGVVILTNTNIEVDSLGKVLLTDLILG